MPASPLSVAVLGLGAMGARIAARLIDAGHAVAVFNRTPARAAPLVARGARSAATPAEAADGADVVLSIVRDDDTSQAVWLGAGGAVGGLRPGAVAVASSTLTPAWTRTLAGHVADAGARFLDAPVVGSRPHAEAGALTFLVGGEAAALDDARPALDVLGGAVHHVGPVGAGMAMKLAVNALFGVQAVALAEVLAGLRREGVGTAEAAALLGALPTASPAAARLGTLMAEGAFAPNFPVALAGKDLGYAARAFAAPLLAAVADAFARAEAAGFGDDDIAGVAQLYG